MKSRSLLPACYRRHRKQPRLILAAATGWLIGFTVAAAIALTWPGISG